MLEWVALFDRLFCLWFSPKNMQLIINGQQQSYDSPLSVQQLVEKLSLQNKRIAIEYNGEIVPRSRFSEQILNEGDQLEIIVAVGGG